MTDPDPRTLMRTAGWPWDRLAEAVYARIDAERSAAAVLEDGAAGVDDRAKAAFELEAAARDEGHFRDELAGVFLLMLRAAVERRPAELLELCHRLSAEADWRDLLKWLVSPKPGGHRWNEGLSREVEALAADVKKLRKENWELARAVVRLQEQRSR